MADKQKIVPCLWFDNACEEAMNFYVSSFSGLSGVRRDQPAGKQNSEIISILRYEKGMETPGNDQMLGKVLTGIFELEGYRFMALDGGPQFKLNPSVSFFVNFDPSRMKDAKENLSRLWGKFLPGGTVRMELTKYPFSEYYGWIEDKYGINWQLMLTDPTGDPRPFIIPSFLFTGKVVGRAEEAADYYLSVFKNSKKGTVARYPAGMEPDREGTVMFSDFMIENQWFAAMDSAHEHGFAFNEAVSFEVNCRDQKEVDRLWEKLSHVPESEQCGWLRDKFGISWQIIPERMGEMLSGADSAKSQRVINAMLKMKKIVLKDLEAAYNG